VLQFRLKIYAGLAEMSNFNNTYEKFVGYMKKSIYDLVQSRLYHKLVCLEVVIAQCLIIETSHSKFQ
jgi:hypothetical protein